MLFTFTELYIEYRL